MCHMAIANWDHEAHGTHDAFGALEPMGPMWPMWPSIAESVVDRLEEDMNKEFVEAQEADVFEPRDRRKDILQKMTKGMQILGRQNELHLRQLS